MLISDKEKEICATNDLIMLQNNKHVLPLYDYHKYVYDIYFEMFVLTERVIDSLEEFELIINN